MKRPLLLAGAALFAVLAMLLPARATPAQALDVWCWDDPVLSINGRLVAINIGVRLPDRNKVQAAHIVVTVPAGTDARVVYIENEFVTPTVSIVHAPAQGPGGARPDKPGGSSQVPTAAGTFSVTVDTHLRTIGDIEYLIEIDRNRKDNQPGKFHPARSNHFHSLSFTLP